MPGLTEEEKERIRAVAQLPRFKRTPELLCPEVDEDAEAEDYDPGQSVTPSG